MKITAQGRSRVVYVHTVADTEIKRAKTEAGKVTFSVNSKTNPGIGQGQYTLMFELEKSEVDTLFEAAMQIQTNARINSLEDEVRDLKRALRDLQ